MRISKALMTGAVAAVAMAGSASAGIVDNFVVAASKGPVTQPSPGAGFDQSSSLAGTGAVFNSRGLSVRNQGSAFSSAANSGTMSVTLGQATGLGSSDRRGSFQALYANSDFSTADLTGTTSFSIGVAGYTGGSTSWELVLSSDSVSNDGANGSNVRLTLSSSAITNGILTFSVASMTQDPDVPAFNWTLVDAVVLNVQRDSVGAAGSTVGFTLSNFAFTAAPVPAPGAIALLGAAGMIGMRRRKA